MIDLRRRAPRVLTAATDGKESIRTCLVPLGPLDDDARTTTTIATEERGGWGATMRGGGRRGGVEEDVKEEDEEVDWARTRGPLRRRPRSQLAS